MKDPSKREYKVKTFWHGADSRVYIMSILTTRIASLNSGKEFISDLFIKEKELVRKLAKLTNQH